MVENGVYQGEIPVKFSEKYFHIDDNGCFSWRGIAPRDASYVTNRRATITIDYKTYTATTYIWEYIFGPIPDGQFPCHKCDNQRCVNLEHLFIGSNLDNSRDRAEKGRYAKYKPSLQLLSADDVREIRRLRAEEARTYKAIGKLFGVDPRAVWQIIKGKTYRNVD